MFAINLDGCLNCIGPFKTIAAILESAALQKILAKWPAAGVLVAMAKR